MLKTEKARLNPYGCLVCNQSEGPFVDFERDQAVAGIGMARLYLCRSCIFEAAEMLDGASAEALQELKLECSNLNEQNIALEQDLVEARANKIVNLDDLRHLFGAAATVAKVEKTKPAA